MHKNIKIAAWPVLFALAVSVAGCKPTERNYKAAYDAALQKRQSEAADPDLNLPSGGLQSMGGPRLQDVGGRQVYLSAEPLKFVDGLEHDMRRYNVAVAAYKMQTNCAAQVSDLFTRGYKAFAARNGDDKYYVIAASFDTLDEAAAFVEEYEASHRDAAYIGLPDAPVIIEKR